MLLLESTSTEPPHEEQLNFLARLSDHASIAIFNAQLYAAVQSANLAKSEFVSFVAHELKNPMTSVKGYTELLAAGAVGTVTDTQANFLNTIRSNIERMNTLVSDLNDLSKIEVGRLRLDYKAIDVPEVIESVVRSTRRQIDEKKQALDIKTPADLPPAWADRTRLEQVLVNLVSNAHKYTPAGGQIVVAAECCPNQWDPAGAPEVIHVWVSDNGHRHQRRRPEEDLPEILPLRGPQNARSTRHRPGAEHHPQPGGDARRNHLVRKRFTARAPPSTSACLSRPARSPGTDPDEHPFPICDPLFAELAWAALSRSE